MANGPDVACRSRLPLGLNYTRGDKIRDCATQYSLGGSPKILGNVSCRTDERRLANRIMRALRLIDSANRYRRLGRKFLLRLLYAKYLFANILARLSVSLNTLEGLIHYRGDLFCRRHFLTLHRINFFNLSYRIDCFKEMNFV